MANILIVDDEQEIRELAAFKLGRSGHETHTEADGDAGLAAALELKPHLILLDWMMPRLTGIEVCVALRASVDFENTPIILLTARAQESDVQRGFAAGATDYVVKPFSPRELLARVDATLGRNPGGSMITATGGLIGFVLGSLGAVVLVLVILTTAGRSVRNRRERRQAERVERARPQLYALVDGDETEIDPASLETIDTLVLAMLPRLRGADRESLRTWLSDRGVLSRSRQRLHSRRSVRRAESAELLGGAGDLDAHYDIRALLVDPDARVRICAARAIGRLGDASSAEALITAYRSPTRPISRGVVGMSILRMGAAAAPQLRSELASPDPLIRALCAELLGHLGDLEAAPVLIGVIDDDADERVRSAAARALGRIGSPDATSHLLALLDAATAETRLAAVWAIGAIGDPTAASVLVDSLHDVDVDVAATAARVVAELSPDQLVELDCCPTALEHASAALSMLQLDGSPR